MTEFRVSGRRSSHRHYSALEKARRYLSKSISAHNHKIDKTNLLAMQKILDHLNMEENTQQILTDDLNKNLPVEKHNRLWENFLFKVRGSESKVERQMINIWKKTVENLLTDIQKLISQLSSDLIDCANKVSDVQIQAKVLYKFYECKLKTRETGSQLEEAKQKYEQKIWELIKMQEKIREKQENIKKEKQIRINFLRKLLLEGYYMEDGLKWILQKFLQLNYQPKVQDFPPILDQHSKKCLIKYYSNLKRKSYEQKPFQDRSKIYRKPVIASNSKTLKECHSNLKQFINNWVKNRDWKKKLSLPQIKKSKTKTNSKEWETQEKKRINFLYSGEKKKQIRKLVFGILLTEEN